MSDLDELKAIAEIHRLKARYFRAMDEKDWAGLEAVFAPEVIADFREASGSYDASQLTTGAAEYVAKLAEILRDVTTVHHGHMPEISLDGPDSATGIWAMEDKLWVGAESHLPFSWMHGYGHYHESYIRLGGGWRIEKIRLSRLRIDMG